MHRSLSVLVLSVMLSLSCQQENPVQPTPSDGNRPPVVGRILGTTQTMEGGIAQFWAKDPSDPDGDSLSYAWDFGDGSKQVGPVSVEHLYIDDGVFTVTLVLSDSRGAADTATATVTINNSPPTIRSVSLSTPSLPAPAPARAVAHVQFEDAGVLDHPRLTIDWGDGTVSSDTTHSYAVPGVYAVSVTVMDKDGAATTNSIWDPIWVYDAGHGPGSPPGYDAIDLGSLGGNRTMSASLNNRGEVVGSSMTADSQYHAFLWKDGFMADIGLQLTGASTAQTINDAGWIGGALTRDYDENSLVIWRSGSPTTVRTGWEDNRASAVAVDDAGQVLVNIAGHEDGISALWRNGALIRLGGFLGGYATAWDMNSRGQIVGTSAFQITGPQAYAWHAFLWEDGAMKDLGDPGRPCIGGTDPYDCGYSVALSINETGQIVGAARSPGALVRAAIWDADSRTPKDLGFGTGRSRAVAINGRGQIAGDSYEPEGGHESDEGYFRDTDGTVLTLGSLGGGGTQVMVMNEGGVVVGSSKTATGEIHPFVWRRETGMVDLGAGAYATRGIAAFPVAINDRGDVTGYVVPCLSYQVGWCQWVGPARAILWRATTPSPVATVRRSR